MAANTEGENKVRNDSKGRLIIFAAVILLAAIIALGVGLGVALYEHKRDHDQYVKCVNTKQTTTAIPTTTLPYPVSASIEGKYRYAAVASEAGECSKVGSDIMGRHGGSAVDAAIAAILCQCVVYPNSCGIGGGHFMVIYNRSQDSVKTIMGRETAPAAATEDMFVQENVSSTEGGLSIAVPGDIAGLKKAWDIGGKLPWRDLFLPAIKLCNEGIRVTKPLAFAISARTMFYARNENLRKMVTDNVTGNLYREGDIIKRPLFGRTLQKIADEGPAAFYNGSLTKDIVQEIQDAGGIITEQDLNNYEAEAKDPVTVTLRDGSKVYSLPPPSSGGVVEFILNILDEFQFTSDSVSTPEKTITTFHRIVEAFKFAFGKRTEFGDPQDNATFQQELDNLIRNMTSDDYAREIRSRIRDDRTFDTDYYEPTFYNEENSGTSHLSVLAPNGDAVSITSTINLYFGSKVVGAKTGIIYNNEMDDFSTPNKINYFGIRASPANFIKPGKRPLSSMSPTIVVGRDGQVRLVLGGTGGTKIITSVAMIIIETLWFDYGIKRAIDAKRIHHQLLPQEIQVESGFPQYVIEGLQKLGHNITLNYLAVPSIMGIKQDGEGNITANSDIRRHGAPDGY